MVSSVLPTALSAIPSGSQSRQKPRTQALQPWGPACFTNLPSHHSTASYSPPPSVSSCTTHLPTWPPQLETPFSVKVQLHSRLSFHTCLLERRLHSSPSPSSDSPRRAGVWLPALDLPRPPVPHPPLGYPCSHLPSP